MIKHYYDKNNKQDWHDKRDAISGLNNPDLVRFGASQMSSVLGMNKWSPKTKLFYNCLGQYLDKTYTESLCNGLMIESFIKQRYQTYSPNEEEMVDNMLNMRIVNGISDVDYILTNSKYPHMFASLDFVRNKGEVRFDNGEIIDYEYAIDAKNVKFNVHKVWDNQLPIYYKIQSHVQMMCMDVEYAEMCCLVEGEKLVIYPVEMDYSLKDRIVNESGDFALQILKAKQVQKCIDESRSQDDKDMYTEVLHSLEPSVDYTESQTELLYSQFDDPDGNIKKGSNISDIWAAKYLKCNRVVALAEQYKLLAKNNLLKYIADANGCMSDEHKVIRVSKNLKPNFRVSKNK